MFLAAAIPSYWTAVDKHTVAAAGRGTRQIQDFADWHFDNAQVSAGLIFAQCMASPEKAEKRAKALLLENPSWHAIGGDEPFFDAFRASAEIPKGDFIPVYNVLAPRENRKKLEGFLGESKSAVVKKILALRGLNTVMLPPAYSAAGAPFEASVLCMALLAQSESFGEEFLYELSEIVSDIEKPGNQEAFEKCAIGVLALSKNLDYSALGALAKIFKSPGDVFGFAKIFAGQKDSHFRCCMYAAAVMSGSSAGCAAYLGGGETRAWGDLSFALERGKGAVDFLLKHKKPVYQNSPAAEFIDAYAAPMKILFAPLCAKYTAAVLALKVLLAMLGGALVAAGIFRALRLGRPSGFAGAWCLLTGLVFATLFFAAFEPSAFAVKIQNSSAFDFKIAFDRIKTNMVGDKDMKFSVDTDSATLAAIALFFVVQMIVYVVCLMRISVIRRTRASASLKLKLLENEDNLFDLGLYIGLAGTVASLILLTFGVITASLMAGYTSTLFGIIFTAMVKIIHLRKLKRKLLIDASNERYS